MNSPLQSKTRKTLPLDFSLLNEQELNALYITDEAVGQSLRLEIRNQSGENLELLEPSTDGRPAHQFELVFRPGVLNEAQLTKLSVQEQGVGLVTHKHEDGTLALRLSLPAASMAVGAKSVITLNNVNPDGRLGSRGTRVMLRYNGVQVHGTDEAISGFRESHLNIVTHLGKRNIPLHVGIVGSGQVLNNGVVNPPLLLRVSNVSNDYRIVASADAERPSLFVILFEVGSGDEEWALGTAEQVKGIGVEYQSGTQWLDAHKLGGDQGRSPEWSVPVPTLEAREYFDIRLSHIVTDHPAGLTNVHIRYENVPGYWDGHFVSLIEKSPIVVRGKQVGIGMAPETGTLQVFNPARYSVSMDGSSETGTWMRIHNSSTGGRAWNIISTGAKNSAGAGNLLFKQDDTGPVRMVLDDSGNVGMGTDNPTEQLQLGEFSHHGDQYLALKTSGGNKHKAGVKFRHNDETYGYTIVSDEVVNGLQIRGRHGSKTEEVPVMDIRGWGDYNVDFKAKRFEISGGNTSTELVLEADTDGKGVDSPTLTLLTNGGNTVGRLGLGAKTRNLSLTNNVSGTTLSVQHDGNIVAYQKGKAVWATHTNLSDITLKTDVKPIDDPLKRLTALNGISFQWKEGRFGRERELGLVAQEVEKLFPELMQPLGQDAKLVQYEKFVPVLVEAIKEQQKMIEALQRKIREFETS
ncbi:tail fiber domain-containing protein [Halomonas cerina]|uniref:Peptidase S74 domain-containing protein n=1 Tax=Halomonas cerina TaxID=447424 RepID=A0A839V9H2_9GAMM|nr:tail fiber domain-containing protein [Halomonas cerina]MBB3190620.1 hypothetical protein [Halomonas cerina]